MGTDMGTDTCTDVRKNKTCVWTWYSREPLSLSASSDKQHIPAAQDVGCTDMRINMRIDRCVGVRTDTRMDVCVYVCVDMSMDMPSAVPMWLPSSGSPHSALCLFLAKFRRMPTANAVG